MFETAGFVDLKRVDSTDDYRRTAAAWLVERERRRDELRVLMGPTTYEQKVKENYETIEAIDQGLLRRFLYVASRRARRSSPSPAAG